MLVYSMTPEEKVMELKRDYWELMIQIKAWGDAFCKEARKMKNIHWITAFKNTRSAKHITEMNGTSITDAGTAIVSTTALSP